MTDLIPAPRPVPTTEDRMRDARTDRTFATYLDRHDRDQLDARAATAEQERDDALDDRDTARAETANLRRELDKANAGRQKHHSELDTMTQVAQGNKRHVTYLTATLDAVQKVVDNYREWNGRVAPLSELDEALNTPQPPSSVPPRRAQEEPVDAHLGDPAGYEIVATRLYRDRRGQLVSGNVVVASAVSTRPTLAEAVDELRRAIGPDEREG